MYIMSNHNWDSFVNDLTFFQGPRLFASPFYSCGIVILPERFPA